MSLGLQVIAKLRAHDSSKLQPNPRLKTKVFNGDWVDRGEHQSVPQVLGRGFIRGKLLTEPSLGIGESVLKFAGVLFPETARCNQGWKL